MACAGCFIYFFMVRLVAYFAVLALLVLITFLALKVLGEWRERSFNEDEGEINPLMHQSDYHKTIRINYGAFEKDLESQTSCNSDGGDNGTSSKCTTLYDAKICIICYDQQRNCFFVPCGHCATCFSCAQRIFYEENRNCPVCRRFMGKIRKFFDS
ncbi:E3 ubiquitin-protein ligase APD2 [Amaranthus tricolor]|uniref:E3 ubiquitin-protein ligase APD2 n=1 Tax=Amaranthus tricolor TaxID=29722 RepID=UPI0025902051|nr:E3 ubiquitin-protein ligase APD2 [Amaranthus tricolor]